MLQTTMQSGLQGRKVHPINQAAFTMNKELGYKTVGYLQVIEVTTCILRSRSKV